MKYFVRGVLVCQSWSVQTMFMLVLIGRLQSTTMKSDACSCVSTAQNRAVNSVRNPHDFPKGNSQSKAFFKCTKSHPKQWLGGGEEKKDFATTRVLVIELAMDEKILASQPGMTGKAKAYTPQKAILSSQPTYLKDSIPLQRSYKTAALLGLLVHIWSPVFWKRHSRRLK